MKNKFWMAYGFIIFVVALSLLVGCASKPIIVKDCQKVEGDLQWQVCSKL
jgi:hypothetical protein